MNFNDSNYFKAWGFTMPATGTFSYRIQSSSVEQIIAQHDIYDQLLADMESFPEAERMLAEIGI